MKPLAFMWPYAVVYWAVFVWSFAPEFGIVRSAQRSTKAGNTADAGSLRVILLGMNVAYFAAFGLAFVHALQCPPALRLPLFVTGLVILVLGTLLRRHCWRVLGASFTGDVQAKPDQQVITAGAYAYVRHPSYTGGILMNTGLALALGGWAPPLLMFVVSFLVYRYRIIVEERALTATIGEPYREFLRTRKRLCPYLY